MRRPRLQPLGGRRCAIGVDQHEHVAAGIAGRRIDAACRLAPEVPWPPVERCRGHVDDRDIPQRVADGAAPLLDVRARTSQQDQRHPWSWRHHRIGLEERVAERATQVHAHATPRERIGDGALLSTGRVALAVHRPCRRPLHRAPVVEDPRDVADVDGGDALSAAQQQVPVLCALHALAEAADLAHERRPVDAEMADVILRGEEHRIPVGLEVRLEALSRLVDLVLVAVDDRGARMREDLGGDLAERVHGQQVVVVEEHHEVALGEGERAVRRRRDVAIALRSAPRGCGRREPRTRRGRAARAAPARRRRRCRAPSADSPARARCRGRRGAALPASRRSG